MSPVRLHGEIDARLAAALHEKRGAGTARAVEAGTAATRVPGESRAGKGSPRH
jgi:hypothetical protein